MSATEVERLEKDTDMNCDVCGYDARAEFLIGSLISLCGSCAADLECNLGAKA